MAVIPSFSAFPRGPDLVGARSKADDINQRAAIAGLNFLNQRRQLDLDAQKLAAAERMNAQDNAVRQQIAEQNAQQEKVKLDISRAYNDSRIGLAKQELENEAMQLGRQYQAQQAYQTELGNLIQSGVPEDQAARTAALKWFPSMGQRIPASAMQPEQDQFEPEVVSLARPSGGEVEVLRTGRGSVSPLAGQGTKGLDDLMAEENQKRAGKLRDEIARLEREIAAEEARIAGDVVGTQERNRRTILAPLEAQLEKARAQLEEITAAPEATRQDAGGLTIRGVRMKE